MTKLRFTDCDIWESNWFGNLSLPHKLFWRFLCDRCDNVGVWDPNPRLVSIFMGEEIDLGSALSALAPEVVRLPSGKWHLVNFVSFQNPGGVGELSAPHKQIRRLLESHGLPLPLSRVLSRVESRLPSSPKDKTLTRNGLDGGSAEGGKPPVKPDAFVALCESLGMASDARAARQWALSIKNVARVADLDEALCCMAWAVRSQRKDGKDVNYARHCTTILARWHEFKSTVYKPKKSA